MSSRNCSIAALAKEVEAVEDVDKTAIMSTESVISLDYRGRVAVLTIGNEAKLNALSQFQYYDLAQKLREIATHDEVFIAVILAKGRFFSALVSCLLPS